jgi:heterodisulfide reductase subunit C
VGILQRRNHYPSDLNDENYLTPVNDETRLQRLKMFIDKTGNELMTTKVCIVCATCRLSCDMDIYTIEDIPNRILLSISPLCDTCQLTEGMLLH